MCPTERKYIVILILPPKIKNRTFPMLLLFIEFMFYIFEIFFMNSVLTNNILFKVSNNICLV